MDLSAKPLPLIKYILTFTDDFSKFTWSYFFTHKSDTFEQFKHFWALVEREFSLPIKTLRTDGGGEYISEDFQRHCVSTGIHRQLTAARTPHQNGVAERKNCTILEAARTIFIVDKFPVELWHECVRAATYILNRCGTRALILKTPFEALYKHKPDLSHLQVLGCTYFVHIPKELRSKLSTKAFQVVLIGYDSNTKAYKCFDPTRNWVIISRDVAYVEEALGDFRVAHHHDVLGDLLASIVAREGEPMGPHRVYDFKHL